MATALRVVGAAWKHFGLSHWGLSVNVGVLGIGVGNETQDEPDSEG